MVNTGTVNRRRAVAITLVAVLLALLVPGVGRAWTPTRTFTARNVVVERESGRWLMDVEATKMGDDTEGGDPFVDLVVTLHKANDPDAAGPLSRLEEHSWDFRNLDPATLQVNDSLSNGALTTGPGALYGFGRLDLEFVRVPGSDPMPVAGCSDANQTRAVDVTGEVVLKTGEPAWEIVREVPARGKIGKRDSTCDPRPCPRRVFGFHANHYTNPDWTTIDASVGNDDDHAAVMFERRPDTGIDRMSITRRLSITVPPERVAIERDLSHAFVQGRSGLGLRGSLTFDAYAGHEPTEMDPSPCGDGKETFDRYISGASDGNLTAAFVTGDEAMPSEVGGRAYKRIVRDAPT